MAKHKLFISILISYSDILIFLSAFQLFLRIYVKMISGEGKKWGENMAIPKYQYIKDELKNKIISGQFASGDKFYT